MRRNDRNLPPEWVPHPPPHYFYNQFPMPPPLRPLPPPRQLLSYPYLPGDNIDARHPLTNAQPQHTITLTLTSPAPGVGGGGLHGSAQPGSTPGSLIVSGIPGLSSSGGQMHYAGASISATPIPQNIQSKVQWLNIVDAFIVLMKI